MTREAGGWGASVTSILAAVLKAGPVPRHVAFVMDGNRRFAKKQHKPTQEGHKAGFNALARVLDLCYQAGIHSVTIFAFSLENFHRSQEEVDHLMGIARSRLLQIAESGDIAEKYGVCVRVIGDIALLPEDVRQSIEKTHRVTQGNKLAVLNVCCPYTSRYDITQAIKRTVEDCQKQTVDPDDVDEDLLDAHMLVTQESPPLDLLVRTSGHQRLSDFMLWQSSSTTIEFVDVLWPEFSVWTLFWILFRWSRRHQLQ